MIRKVYDLIETRKSSNVSESYVAKLMHQGLDSILKKVAEESGEVIISAKNADKQAVTRELCDLLFHALVMMSAKEIHPDDVCRELERRFGVSGLEEKKNRKKRTDNF